MLEQTGDVELLAKNPRVELGSESGSVSSSYVTACNSIVSHWGEGSRILLDLSDLCPVNLFFLSSMDVVPSIFTCLAAGKHSLASSQSDVIFPCNKDIHDCGQ